jgi:hypothetical protein
VPWFIYKSMVAHYKECLAVETDPHTIMTLRGLLAEEEETELAEHKAKNNLPPKAL